ncbi:MAG: recombinase family protein [Chloroflexota bacterium]|nr:recombinase family protein [Chloroflexota bacterium]
MPQSTEKRTAIYARSSTKMRTTESQLEACRRVAEHLGFDVVQEFVDEDISGTVSTKSRPGTLELFASLSSFEILLVYRLDRLSRSATELVELLRDFAASGVEVWSVADLPIPARILTDQIAQIAAFAEAERSAILQRMDHGVRLAAEKGKWLGGPIPFGYDLDANGALTPSSRLVAGMAEAELARSVFEHLAAGSSTVKEARRMNELGVFPGRRYSNKVVRMKRSIWFPSRINAMVRNALYKGVHCIEKRSGTIERRVAPLVSADLWQAAQDAIRANRSCEPGRPARPHLLRGLMSCDDCGLGFAATRVSSPQNNWRGLYYRCSGQIGTVEPDPQLRCKAKSVPALSIEKLVWEYCVRMEPSAATATGFDQQRPVIERCVRRIGVHTVGVRPHKVAFVRVEYADGTTRTFRFARGDGAAL